MSVFASTLLFVLGVLSGAIASYSFHKYRARRLRTTPASVLSLLGRPTDFNEMLFQTKLLLVGDKATLEVVYLHRYAGLHEIGFCCEQPIRMPITMPIRVRVKARWQWLDSKGVIEKEDFVSLDKPWYDGPLINGFSLIRYNVPESIPVDKRISLVIEIDNCEQIVNTYGAISAYGRNVQTP